MAATGPFVFTLCAGDYHLGAAALLNSLCACGLQGHVVIGFAGEPPWWRTQLRSSPGMALRATEAVTVEFAELADDRSLPNMKPRFILSWLAEHGIGDADTAIFYFDADIVVKAKWAFFADWSRRGVALCEDADRVGRDHPFRSGWHDFAREAGIPLRREVGGMFNAGFLGLMAEHLALFETWEALMLAFASETGISLRAIDFAPGATLSTCTRDYDAANAAVPFPFPELWYVRNDQDLLNLALMCCDVPLSTIDPLGMDLGGEGHVMSHAAGTSRKPWHRGVMERASNLADLHYWRHARHPIDTCRSPWDAVRARLLARW